MFRPHQDTVWYYHTAATCGHHYPSHQFKAEPCDWSVQVWHTGLSILPPYSLLTVFVCNSVDNPLLQSYLLCQPLSMDDWCWWSGRSEHLLLPCDSHVTTLSLKKIVMWSLSEHIEIVSGLYLNKGLSSAADTLAFMLYACRDVKKHHCFWHTVRLASTYFSPWPIIIIIAFFIILSIETPWMLAPIWKTVL